jgi:hypothetical protein
MGFDSEGEEDEIHIPTAGSSSASLHRSMSGKRDAGGSAAASTEVACAQEVRIAGVAEGSCFGGFAGANRDLIYGTTVPDRTCFTWSLEFELEDGQEAASIKVDSFINTVSSAGT